jgi:hypothetical protein
MGERGDIIKTMQRAMTEARLERSPEFHMIHDPNQETAPIVGVVVACGLADEMAQRRYLVIDGIDGRGAGDVLSVGRWLLGGCRRRSRDRALSGAAAYSSRQPNPSR